ncbi:MAG: 4'-phosphopantetheinyl transferase superfamily protein [Lachnospiraceae bacterium]|nr:4'-phosphopantetheinyl transferase superfamily protein [Lachnospiraceae bacterium]
MQKILICNCKSLTEKKEYERAYRQTSAFRQKKADACKQEMDKARCICAGLLLREAFFSYAQSCREDLLIKDGAVTAKTEESAETAGPGKLALEYTISQLMEVCEKKMTGGFDLPEEMAEKSGRTCFQGEGKARGDEPFAVPYLTISHSGDYAAAVVSDSPIGLDIQKKRHFSDSMIRKFLSGQEFETYQQLLGEGSERAEGYLLQLWCDKEAAAKLDGRGIFAMLPELTKDDWREKSGILTTEIAMPGEYAGAVACR